MLDTLARLFEFFAGLVPHLTLIRSTHRGVKFKPGGRTVALEPGLHWYWPTVTDLVTIPSARQTLCLESQVVTTPTGETLAVTGVVTFTIADVEAALSKSWDVDDTVSDIARAAVMSVVALQCSQSLRNSLSNGKLSEALTRRTRSALEPYGVAVQRCDLVDFAQSKVLRLIGSSEPAVVDDEDD